MHTPATAHGMPNRMWVAVASGTQGAVAAIRAAASTCTCADSYGINGKGDFGRHRLPAAAGGNRSARAAMAGTSTLAAALICSRRTAMLKVHATPAAAQIARLKVARSLQSASIAVGKCLAINAQNSCTSIERTLVRPKGNLPRERRHVRDAVFAVLITRHARCLLKC